MIKLIFLISHKYLNHGTCVPAQKCSNLIKYNHARSALNSYPFSARSTCKVRAYSTSSPNDNNSSDDQFIPAAIYEDALSMKKAILKDNDGKAGIYMLTNKLTGDIYVGQSVAYSTYTYSKSVKKNNFYE